MLIWRRLCFVLLIYGPGLQLSLFLVLIAGDINICGTTAGSPRRSFRLVNKISFKNQLLSEISQQDANILTVGIACAVCNAEIFSPGRLKSTNFAKPNNNTNFQHSVRDSNWLPSDHETGTYLTGSDAIYEIDCRQKEQLNSFCMKLNFFLTCAVGLWVLRPLLAYCTSPG
jgi:hypothetical protein